MVLHCSHASTNYTLPVNINIASFFEGLSVKIAQQQKVWSGATGFSTTGHRRAAKSASGNWTQKVYFKMAQLRVSIITLQYYYVFDRSLDSITGVIKG